MFLQNNSTTETYRKSDVRIRRSFTLFYRYNNLLYVFVFFYSEPEEYRKPEEDQVNSEQISRLCTQIQDIHSRIEIKRSECRDLEESNVKLTKLLDQIRLAVTKLERDIGPTVRSSSVKMEDAENLVVYIRDFKNRIVSGCLLHSD